METEVEMELLGSVPAKIRNRTLYMRLVCCNTQLCAPICVGDTPVNKVWPSKEGE